MPQTAQFGTWYPEASAPFVDAADPRYTTKTIPVLICTDNGTQAVAHKIKYKHRAAWWIDNSFGFNEDGEIYNVTHWMPLPERPVP